MYSNFPHVFENSVDDDSQFVQSQYSTLKALNPSMPILIRECTGIEPKLYTRFAGNVEKEALLSNLSAADVEAKLKAMVADAKPSPQPFVFKDIV